MRSTAKLSFSGEIAYHYCVILSERSESKNLLRILFLQPERSFDFAQDDTCGVNDYTGKLSFISLLLRTRNAPLA